MPLIRYLLRVIAAVIMSATGQLFSQVEYLPANLYSNNIDTNIIFAEQYLKNPDIKENPQKMLNMTGFLVNNYLIKSKYRKAEIFLIGCLGDQKAKQSASIRATLLYWMGNVKRYTNDLPEALKCYFESVKIFTDLGYWPSIMACKIELAEIFRKTGKYERAKEFLREALFLKEDKNIQSPYLEMKLYNRAAAIENEIGSHQKSISYSTKSIGLARKINDLYYEASSYNELGSSYKNSNRLDSAILCYTTAEKMFNEIGAYEYAIHTLENRAMLYNHNNYSKKLVFDTYHKIEELVDRYDVDYPMGETYGVLYYEYLTQGDSIKSFGYFYKYHGTVIDALTKKSEEKLIEMTKKYDNEKIQSELDITNQKLNKTAFDLKQRKRENIIIYSFLLVLILLMILIIYLLVKLNRTNKKLHQRNKEKDIFIQEIHHRVKNNLQFVSSLINVQMNASSDTTEVTSLNEASRRIRAMALVHEMLYKQEEAIGVSIKQYLEELIHTLTDLINSESIRIEFKPTIINRDLSITAAVALGMITSELISNSIKYAFVNIKQPSIEILLEKGQEKDELHFVVRDNETVLYEMKAIRKNWE